jgi:hypothetical protein
LPGIKIIYLPLMKAKWWDSLWASEIIIKTNYSLNDSTNIPKTAPKTQKAPFFMVLCFY